MNTRQVIKLPIETYNVSLTTFATCDRQHCRTTKSLCVFFELIEFFAFLVQSMI